MSVEYYLTLSFSSRTMQQIYAKCSLLYIFEVRRKMLIKPRRRWVPLPVLWHTSKQIIQLYHLEFYFFFRLENSQMRMQIFKELSTLSKPHNIEITRKSSGLNCFANKIPGRNSFEHFVAGLTKTDKDLDVFGKE